MERSEKQHVIDIEDAEDSQESTLIEYSSPLYKLLVTFVLTLLTLAYVRSLFTPVYAVDVVVDVRFEEPTTVARAFVPIPTESPFIDEPRIEYIITWEETVLQDGSKVEIPVQAHWPGVAWPTQSASPDDYPEDDDDDDDEQDEELFRLQPYEADDPSFIDEIHFAQTVSL